MKKNAMLTLLLSVFIAFLGIGIIIPIMPVFATELGAGGLGLGMIIAAFSISRGALLPVVGNLSDKWGRKSFLASGLLIYGIVGLLIPMAESVVNLVSIRAFHGIGSAMIVPVAMAYMSVLAPAGSEGRYMSYLNIAIFCGIGCGPIIGGVVYDYFGFPSVFHLMAALSSAALVLVLVQMPPHAEGQPKQYSGILQSLRLMFNCSMTSGILLARYATMIIMVPTMAFLPLIMSTWPETNGFLIGVVIAGRTLINALLQVPFGRLSDRCDKLILLIGSSLLLAVTVLFIPWIKSFTGMLVLYLLLGAEEAAVWAVLGAYASIEAKIKYGHGTMMGVFSLAMSAGIFTGAVLTGLSLDWMGITAAFMAAGSAVIMLTGCAAYMIYTGKGADLKEMPISH